MTPERLADDCQHKNRHWRVFCVECVAGQEAHIRDLEAQLAAARESVGLVRMMLETSRARRSLRAPEDDGIRSLCERIGYGAVIDSAARLWQRKDPIGAFAVGPCMGTLESALATATQPSEVDGFGDLIGSTPSLPWPRWDATPPSPEVGE